MKAASSSREYVPLRYFGPTMWIYAICTAAVFVAIPPYPSSGSSWTRRIVFAIVIGVGGGLVNIWSDRRQERRLRAQLDSESTASGRPSPKERS